MVVIVIIYAMLYSYSYHLCNVILTYIVIVIIYEMVVIFSCIYPEYNSSHNYKLSNSQ